MAKKTGETLRRGEIVHAAEDLPGVPAGTRGRVSLVSGLTWIRYRVDFDNGRDLGQLDRRLVARPDEWRRLEQERQRADAEARVDGDPGQTSPQPAGDAPEGDTDRPAAQASS